MLSMKFDGGKAVVQRILQAYGFTMQKQLHDHLGVGNGTVSTWIKRNYFPGEVVIRCALETGADLEWLATGRAVLGENKLHLPKEAKSDLVTFSCKILANAILKNDGLVTIDRKILKENIGKPLLIRSEDSSWVVDEEYGVFSDGIWLINRKNAVSVKEVMLVPGGNLLIDNIKWPENEINIIAKAILKLESL